MRLEDASTDLQSNDWLTAEAFDVAPSFLISPSISTDTHAMLYFLRTWSKIGEYRTRPVMTFLDVLPSFYETSSSDSAINQALLSIAYRVFANSAGYSPDLHKKALLEYGRAVKALGRALMDPDQVQSDETLATILVLMFQEVSHPPDCLHRPR